MWGRRSTVKWGGGGKEVRTRRPGGAKAEGRWGGGGTNIGSILINIRYTYEDSTALVGVCTPDHNSDYILWSKVQRKSAVKPGRKGLLSHPTELALVAAGSWQLTNAAGQFPVGPCLTVAKILCMQPQTGLQHAHSKWFAGGEQKLCMSTHAEAQLCTYKCPIPNCLKDVLKAAANWPAPYTPFAQWSGKACRRL